MSDENDVVPHISGTVRWELWLITKTQIKAKKAVAKFVEALGVKADVEDPVVYEKGKIHWEVELTTKLSGGSVADKLLEFMLLCRKVAPRWLITGPYEEDGLWGMQGCASKELYVQGISDVGFEVDL